MSWGSATRSQLCPNWWLWRRTATWSQTRAGNRSETEAWPASGPGWTLRRSSRTLRVRNTTLTRTTWREMSTYLFTGAPAATLESWTKPVKYFYVHFKWFSGFQPGEKKQIILLLHKIRTFAFFLSNPWQFLILHCQKKPSNEIIWHGSLTLVELLTSHPMMRGL